MYKEDITYCICPHDKEIPLERCDKCEALAKAKIDNPTHELHKLISKLHYRISALEERIRRLENK